jgi:drug/metabolite transporter (DMT)-like permease
VIVDVVLVLVFAVIGRASHDENPAGFLLTAWPFLVALLVGHAVAALLPGRPRRPWSVLWGLVVWVITVIGGMLLRIASGDTAQVAFIIVATLTLGVFLVGWRALTGLLRRRRTAAVAHEQDDLRDLPEAEQWTDAEADASQTADPDEQPSDPGRPAS